MSLRNSKSKESLSSKPNDSSTFSGKSRRSGDFVPPNTPLGMSTTTTHYIKPVPGYTTEYEAEYVWPKQPSASTSRSSMTGNVPAVSTNTPRWNKLLSVCDQLIDQGTEVDQLKTLRAKIQNHPLDPTLEKSMCGMIHKVEEQVSLRDAAKQNDGESCEPPENRGGGVRMVSDEVFELYLKLVDKLNDIKNA